MLEKYLSIIKDGYSGYWDYLTDAVSSPSFYNYFYYLIVVSLAVFILEVVFPWRRDQDALRKSFWLDGFYMFFNFFLFSLIGFNALSNVGVVFFGDILALVGFENQVALHLESFPLWVRILVLFVLADFIQWSVHLLLHRISWMWEFHKVHHSVTEMGFSAHLRFHWMESVFYKTALFLPLTMIGFGLSDLFLLHAFNILIGHLNHANFRVDYGPLKYIFNSPRMHIWHHAKELPKKHSRGVNFGISLSVWDYIFGTAHMPTSGKNLKLGFEGDENYPKNFLDQSLQPFKSKKADD